MLAMALTAFGTDLQPVMRSDPTPGPGEVRLRVHACGVCRTDLHVVDGDLHGQRFPIVPGHEVVGVVDAIGDGVVGIRLGQRLGAPWLGATCGVCRYCAEGAENLCDAPRFNGWTRDGGYADMMIVDARFAIPLPDSYTDEAAAPLLCAGLIGFRSWRKACAPRVVKALGLFGFGAAAHLLAQLAIHDGQDVYAFTRTGDEAAQALARGLGCRWAGGSDDQPNVKMDAAIIFAPVGALVPAALKAVRKGGTVVCGGIHMSDIPSFPYSLLWEERQVLSVANLTRQDAIDYFPRAAAANVTAHVTSFPLLQANEALRALRAGAFTGAAVLKP